MTSRISAREVLLECTKRAGRKRNRQPLVACRRIGCALSRGLFVIAIAAGTAYVHAMFVALTVCEASGIRLDGHVKHESRRAAPESSKQTWRRNIAKTRRKSTPTMDLHRRTSEASLALVWSGYGGGMVVLPCGSGNYLVLLSLQRKCCTVQRWPFDHLSALLILTNEKTAPEVPLSAAELHRVRWHMADGKSPEAPLSAAELHLGHQAKVRNRTQANSFRLSRAGAKFKLPRMKRVPVEPVPAAIPSPAQRTSAAGDLPAPPPPPR